MNNVKYDIMNYNNYIRDTTNIEPEKVEELKINLQESVNILHDELYNATHKTNIASTADIEEVRTVIREAYSIINE